MHVLKSHKNFLFNRGRGKPYKDEVKTYSAFSRDPDPYTTLNFYPTLSNVPLASAVHVPVTDETEVEDEFFAYRWYKIRKPAAGVGVHERVGSSIFLRSIYLKGFFQIKTRLQRPIRLKLMMMETKNRYTDVSFRAGYLNEFDNLPTAPLDNDIPDSPQGANAVNDWMAKAYYLSSIASSTADTCRIKKVWEATLYPQDFKASVTTGQSYGINEGATTSVNTQTLNLTTFSTSYHKFSTVIKINRHYDTADYGLYFMWMVDSCLNINDDLWNDYAKTPGANTAAMYRSGISSFVTPRADRLGINLKFYSKAYYTDS